MSENYQDINAKTIDRWVENGWEWGTPITHEQYLAAKEGSWSIVLTPIKPVPAEWFPDLKGKSLLGLACGGGHESPRPCQRKASGHDGGKIYGEHDKIARLNVRGQLDERVAKGPPEHPAVARGMCSFG